MPRGHQKVGPAPPAASGALMPFLFDTDAISEVLRERPSAAYLQWLRAVPREDQFTSAVVAAELYRAALEAGSARLHLENVEKRVLPGVTVLPFDAAIARVCGEIESLLNESGEPLADADLQIAATAIRHGLKLVTGNVERFEKVPGLVLCRVLAKAAPASAPARQPTPSPTTAPTPARNVPGSKPARDGFVWMAEED